MLVEKLSQQSALEHSLNLLPNSEVNKEKLKNLIEKNRGKIDSLQLQTNNHKLRLREKLGKLQKIEEDKLVRAESEFCTIQITIRICVKLTLKIKIKFFVCWE